MPQFPHWAKGRRQGKEVSPQAFLLRRSMIPGAHDGISQPGPDLRPLLSQATRSKGPRPRIGPGPGSRTAGLRSGSAVGSREVTCGSEYVPQPDCISLAPGSLAPAPSPRRCRDHTETRSSNLGTASLHLRGVKGGHTAA